MAEGYETKSNEELGRVQSQLKASCVTSLTDELWYKQTASL